MDEALSSINELLEQRIGLMRELAESLERGQAAVLSSDWPKINAQTERQQELCQQLRQLVSDLGADDVPAGASVPGAPFQPGETVNLPPVRARRKALLAQLAEVKAQVADSNRAYGALLRRARRTVDIFCRVLANSGVTYVPPGLQAASAGRDSKG
jgi:hypothetical protein